MLRRVGNATIVKALSVAPCGVVHPLFMLAQSPRRRSLCVARRREIRGALVSPERTGARFVSSAWALASDADAFDEILAAWACAADEELTVPLQFAARTSRVASPCGVEAVHVFVRDTATRLPTGCELRRLSRHAVMHSDAEFGKLLG